MSLTFTPHEYQETAIVKLLSQAAVGLFQDPGLGKTVEVLSAFKILLDQGKVDCMWVIAPLRPCYSVWPDEIKKWAHLNDLTYTIVHGKDKLENLDKGVDIYLINPEAIQWLLDTEAFPFRLGRFFTCSMVLCIDESTRFKNSTSKRSKELRKWIHLFDRRWLLTGTPMPNSIEDIFGQVLLLDGGAALGRYITGFRNIYMHQPNPRLPFVRKMNPGSFDIISDKIAPLVLRMKATDYLNMPDLMFNDIFIELPPAAREQYREVEDEFITMIENEAVVAANAAVAGTKCRQIANGAVYLEGGKDWVEVHDEKLLALDSLMEELGDQPKLLLYEYRHDLERITDKYGKLPNLSGCSPAQADILIGRFNMGLIPTLLGHPASMGHGLNIQAKCHHAIWFGITWNYEYYDQAIRRIFRQGQKSDHVMIHRIIARNTKDEQVAAVLLGKEARQEDILSAVVRTQSVPYYITPR